MSLSLIFESISAIAIDTWMHIGNLLMINMSYSNAKQLNIGLA
jgi:hypothetical protein